jgi:nitrogen fixation-related uncharacterized protein
VGSTLYRLLWKGYEKVTTMDEATIALTVMTVAIFLVFLGFLIWGIKSRQFHNVEEAKYQVFRKQRKSENDSTGKEEDRKGR